MTAPAFLNRPAPDAAATGRRAYGLALDRLEALRALNLPGLVLPTSLRWEGTGVVPEFAPDGSVALDQWLAERRRAVAGGRVQPWSLGQCVTVGIQLAQILRAVDRVGLSAPRVSAATVRVADGAVVMRDCCSEPLAPDAQGGPQDYSARAVEELGLLLQHLGAGVERADRLEAWLEPMLAEEPRARPSAEVVARALADCAQPEPLDDPLRAPGVIKLASGRWWRARLMATRLVSWAAVAAVVVSVCVVVVPRGVEALEEPRMVPLDQPVPVDALVRASPKQAASQLTLARFAAWGGANGDELVALTLPGSVAHGEATAEAASLAEGQRFQGLVASVDAVEVLSVSDVRASVKLAYRVGAYRSVSGKEETAQPGFSQEVELDLRWTPQGWKVERARPRT